jgi:hypothetical protein
VERLTGLIDRTIAPEPARVMQPRIERVEPGLGVKERKLVSTAYEDAVFAFLASQGSALGIDAVWRCSNVRIDGLVDLDDGRRLALEIKYRMNWEKACQACTQIGWFLRHPEAKAQQVAGGLVVFEEFSADWWRTAPSRSLQNGWNYWYTEHDDVDGLPVHLLRFREGFLESYLDALAVRQRRRHRL